MLKRKNMIKMLGIGSLCLFLLGCSKESFIARDESSSVILEEEVVPSDEPLLSKNDEKSVSVLEENQSETLGAQKQNATCMVLEESAEAEIQIAVHICGAVKQPGVYYLKESQRLYEGIQKAGGFLEEADQNYLNLAMMLEDGMKVIVPTKEETSAITEEIVAADEYLQKRDTVEKSKVGEQNEKVDLNTADEALLCTLPGIGESRAKSIIAYREKHGLFQKIEDVMKVSGIKEAAYEKLKDYVTVSK